jgi:hypothetical protein
MTDHAYLRAPLDTLDIAAVREVFGGTWHIFRAGQDYCALRRGGGVIFWDGPASLLQPCVCAERPDDLARQLCL